MDDGTRSNRVSQTTLLDVIQRGESHVYALLTRHGAVKIGVTGNLAKRKTHMAYGGVAHFLAFAPGEYADEQAIHAGMADDLRLPGRREYYYPLHEYVLPPINLMREAMQLPPLARRDLPRPGHWARLLPRPNVATSWPQPKTWDLQYTA